MMHGIKIMRINLAALLTLLIVLPSAASAAEGYKIGFVSVVKLIELAPQGEVATKKIEAEFGPRDKAMRKQQEAMQKLETDLQKNALVMKASKRDKMQADLTKMERHFKRETEEFREDYNLRRNEELKVLQKVVREAINEVGKENKFDLILTESVIYASDRANITELVLKKLRSKK
jgi:outer membrane protein